MLANPDQNRRTLPPPDLHSSPYTVQSLQPAQNPGKLEKPGSNPADLAPAELTLVAVHGAAAATLKNPLQPSPTL